MPASLGKLLYVDALDHTVCDCMQQDIRVGIKLQPGTETDVFRISAADEILRLLVDAHETEFTIAELVDATDLPRSTVWRAVQLLEEIDVIQIRKTPQRNYISIDPDHLKKPDPVLAIEQEEFHTPVRAFITDVTAALEETSAVDSLVGIVLFGSVARGEADRKSDIDLFVVVEGDRTTARRCVTDIVSNLRERSFEGDRFEFEPYVETVDSALRAKEKLRPIFEEGICVYGTDALQSLRKEVFTDE